MEIIQEQSGKTIINNDINYDLIKMILEIQAKSINIKTSKINNGIDSNHRGSYNAQAKTNLIKPPKSFVVKFINNDMKEVDANLRTKVEALADTQIACANNNIKGIHARTETMEKEKNICNLERKLAKGNTNRAKVNARVVTIDSEMEVEQEKVLISNTELEHDNKI